MVEFVAINDFEWEHMNGKSSNLCRHSGLYRQLWFMQTIAVYGDNCGFTTEVEATMQGGTCNFIIQSECTAIQKLAEDLKQVNPYEEISFRRGTPSIHEKGMLHCTHASCPVPVGIIKAVEVEAKLALPTDVTIKLSVEL